MLIPLIAAGVAGVSYLVLSDSGSAPSSGPGSKPVIEPGVPKFIPGVQTVPTNVEPKPRTPPVGPVIPPVIPGLPTNVLPPNVLPPDILPPLVLPPSPSPIPGTPIAPALDTAVVITVRDPLSIRSQPNTSARRLGIAAKGSRVKVLDTAGGPTSPGAPKGWMRIMNSAGINGFASAEFLQLDALPSPAPLPVTPGPSPVPIPAPIVPTIVGDTAVVTGTPGNNLRNQPSTKGSIITGVLKGVRVRLAEGRTPSAPNAGAPMGWLKVTTPAGITGFMSAQFLAIDGTPSVSGEVFGREGMIRRGNMIRG